MKITLLARDSGKRNYSNNWDCPIAAALKRAGFKRVCVGSFSYDVTHKGITYRDIRLNKKADTIALEWAHEKQTEDRDIIIQGPSKKYMVK